MNSASNWKISRAVKQTMNKEGDRPRTEMNKMMMCLRDELKMENTSDTDHETARRQARRVQRGDAKEKNTSDTEGETTTRQVMKE